MESFEYCGVPFSSEEVLISTAVLSLGLRCLAGRGPSSCCGGIGASRCGGGLVSSASSCGGVSRLRVVAFPLAVGLAPRRHQRTPMGLFR